MPRKKRDNSSTVPEELKYTVTVGEHQVEIPYSDVQRLQEDGTLFDYLNSLTEGHRYVKYCPVTAWSICDALMQGSSLRAILKNPGMPSRMTIYRWLRTHDEFRKQFELARRMWAENEFERVIEIADNVNPIDNTVVNKARLRIDTRKWVVSKMLPKKYGKEGLGYEERDPKELLQEMMNLLPDNLRSAVLELNQVRLHLEDVTTTRVKDCDLIGQE